MRLEDFQDGLEFEARLKQLDQKGSNFQYMMKCIYDTEQEKKHIFVQSDGKTREATKEEIEYGTGIAIQDKEIFDLENCL